MQTIDTLQGKLYFCKPKQISECVGCFCAPPESLSFNISEVEIKEDVNKSKYLKATFEADGPWDGFNILLEFKEKGKLEGELQYVSGKQAPGMISASYVETERGYYIYGTMLTLGESRKEGIIIFAENPQLLVSDYGITALENAFDEETEDLELEDLDDEPEEEFTNLFQYFVHLQGKELLKCCQSYIIYVLLRLGYKVIPSKVGNTTNFFIEMKNKKSMLSLLPSFSNRTWHSRNLIIKRNYIYILVDIHENAAVPDVYIFKGSQLSKMFKKDSILTFRDPAMVLIRNVWDLLVDDAPPF